MRFLELAAIFACLSRGNATPTTSSLQTNQSKVCSETALRFTQAIDHYGGQNGTFQQKFFMLTEFYKPGGPVLLFQGEESSSLDCIDSTVMYDFARELNGIVVNLEHRYFGESVPFGPDLTIYSSDEWKYLTLDNVMQDAVEFVDSVRRNVTGAGSAHVFAASGSYGGFLMTMFRQNHPDTFRGVISSAPPLRAFFGGNQTSVPGQYNWWNYISRVYREKSAVAASKIQIAFRTLVEMFSNNDISSLQSELGLCDPITDNSTAALISLSSLLQQVYANGAEFNYNFPSPGRTPIANPLQKFVDIAIEEQDPLQILNRTNWAWYSASAATAGIPYTCFNQSNVAELTILDAPLISTIPFDYIVCAYLQFSATNVDNGTIFLPSGDAALTNAEREQTCRETYGVGALTPAELYARYHFTDAELQNSTGIIFSLAQYDPTTSVSGADLFEMPLRADNYASRRILTTGMGHREDLFAQGNQTRATVRLTNQIELEILKEWMALEGNGSVTEPRHTI